MGETFMTVQVSGNEELAARYDSESILGFKMSCGKLAEIRVSHDNAHSF